ncbi:hypothetical protein EB74_01930 [Mycobacterium sp. SWH-M5]|nr:hypothetical protein EB74_01930 [Mycobacterium sp. SWH-M5]
MSAFGGRNMMTGEASTSIDEIVGRATDNPGTKLMILPPLIHGAAQWAAMTAVTDAFVVRMTVVPAVMSMLGDRAWWLPERLERILPDLDIEGEQLSRQLSEGDSETRLVHR